MDLGKIKELKVLLDAGTLSQDEFSSLKKKIINGEDVSLDHYNQEQDSIKSNNDDTSVTTNETNSSSQYSEAPQKSVNLDNYKRQIKWQQY
tara:strand:+ start:2664 stop:2936 length:273 start_codon:yes stop_codon:yes gene_type:complete